MFTSDFTLSPQCKVDKLVFIDVAESSTRGGSTDLEIFSLPNVEVFRGTSVCLKGQYSVFVSIIAGTKLPSQIFNL